MWGIALHSLRTIWRARPVASSTDGNDVARLSRDIEKRILETLAPIDEASAPQEIRPLIHTINRLIAHFEDRSLHEQEFSANASHELRTPLAGIRLQAELAMSTKDASILKNAHENILNALDRSERLIEQLLVIARLSVDRADLKMEKISLGRAAAHVVGELLSLAQKSQIKLNMTPWKACDITASAESISILIHNLVRNAINHTPEGGKVVVRVTTIKGRAILTVTDNGPGISIDKRAAVLKRFQKAGDGSKPGSGLGLAIVKRICDLHHATLGLNQPDGHGGLSVSVIFMRSAEPLQI